MVSGRCGLSCLLSSAMSVNTFESSLPIFRLFRSNLSLLLQSLWGGRGLVSTFGNHSQMNFARPRKVPWKTAGSRANIILDEAYTARGSDGARLLKADEPPVSSGPRRLKLSMVEGR